jgi:ATP-dependent Lon protease
MPERRTLPVLSTGTSVIFPGPPVTVAVMRADSMRAIEAAMRHDHTLFAVAELDGAEQLRAEDLPTIGVISRVERVQMGRGALQAVLVGQHRATCLEYRAQEPLTAVVVPVQEIPPPDPADTTFTALLRETRERAIELGKGRGIDEDVIRRVLGSVPDAGPFTDLVANYLEIGVREKQQLLETLAVETRLRRVLVHVQRQLELLHTQQDIKKQVQEELGEQQRELYLREQLKAIRRELGEGGERDDIVQLRERLDALELSEEARAEVDRELLRLERSASESLEAQVLRSYLEWISELPWGKRSEDSLDLTLAARTLDADHFGLQDVKDRVLEFLAVRVLNARRVEQASQTAERSEARARAVARGPISLFIGPPGVGKTSIAEAIARALGRKYVRVALGGARDEADIRGHRRTYVAAMPGRIIQGLKRAGTKNPVFLLDEVDKLVVSSQGDPASALLEVLDPAQNGTFTDHYLGVAFDLSEVLFIATGNFIHQIPPPLLDRMEVIEFAGYTEREKLEIARRYLLPRQLSEAGLADTPGSPTFTDEALSTIISEYTRESGVRQLERRIGAVARKLARLLASEQPAPERVTPEAARALLGRPQARPEQVGAQDTIGVATGMYYTPAGGDIMFVEAAVRRLRSPSSDASTDREEDAGSGDVSLILTGQLGDVMRESARAALTYVTNHARELQLPRDLGRLEAHVHVPAGAVPKDGPSAGVTIATALASALTRRPVHRELAMTGEITLNGRVLPIGGVKEKLLGAQRAGVTRVIIPRANEPDLQDLPEEVRNGLSIIPVESLSEVLEQGLRPVER